MREWGWLLAPEQRERAQAQAAPAAPAQQLPSIPQVGGPGCGWRRWVAMMGGGAALLFKAQLVLSWVFGAPVACPPSTQLAKPSPVSLWPLCVVLQELVNIQAYILWEQAGKPDGADFGDRARQVGGGAGIDEQWLGIRAGAASGGMDAGCSAAGLHLQCAAQRLCSKLNLKLVPLHTCPHLPTTPHLAARRRWSSACARVQPLRTLSRSSAPPSHRLSSSSRPLLRPPRRRPPRLRQPRRRLPPHRRRRRPR